MKKYELISSIITLIVGIILMFVPGGLIRTLVKMVGVLIILFSAFVIVNTIKSKKSTFEITYGILISILGLVFLFSPDVIASIIPFILGIYIIIQSSIKLQHIYNLKKLGEDCTAALIINIITLLLGIFIIFNPFKGAKALIRVIGIIMILSASLNIIEDYMTRPKKVKVIK